MSDNVAWVCSLGCKPFRDTSRVALAGLLLAASVACSAAAQEPTGIIRIVAPENAPATPGAIVVVESLDGPPLLLQPALPTAATPAIVRHLPPGRYAVSIAAGTSVGTPSRLVLSPGETVTFALEPGGAQGGVPGLRLVGSDSGAEKASLRLTRVDLESLPAAPAFWSLLDTADPQVITDRIENGGLWPADHPRLAAAGQSWRQTIFRLDGIEITAPSAGEPMLLPSSGTLASIFVTRAARSAEWGGAGPTVTLMTRPPGRQWFGQAAASFVPEAWQASSAANALPPGARYVNNADGELVAGGPLARRVGLVASLRASSTERLERGDPLSLSSDVGSTLERLLLTPGARNRVSVVYSADATSFPYPGRARFRGRDVQENDTLWHFDATWDRWTESGSAWSFSGAYQRAVLAPDFPPPTSGPALDFAATVERLVAGPVPALFARYPGVEQRWDFSVDAQPRIEQFSPRHEFRAGWQMVSSAKTVVNALTQLVVAETVNGLPARIWDYGYLGPESRWQELETTGFVSDRLRLWPRIVIDAGLRIEAGRGKASGAANEVGWFSALPRTFVRWTPGEMSRFALFGGYGRYRHRLPLDVFAWGDRTGPAGFSYRWNDANGDRLPQPSELGELVAAVGPCCNGALLNSIDPQLKQPHADEFTVGFESRLGSLVFRFTGIDRRNRDLLESVNVGVTASDYTVRLVPDPGADWFGPADDTLLPVYDRTPRTGVADRYVLTNPAGHDALYQGLELTIEKRPGGCWHTRFGATAYRAEGNGANVGFRAIENDPGVVGELFDNPNATTNARGRLFADRAYVIKWSGGYRAPHDVNIAAVARYQDGQPFARVVVVPDLSQGPEAILAYPRGRTRFTFTFTLDTRVEKGFRIGRVRASGVLDVYNLLNTRNEVEEDPVTGPTFRATTLVQPPRAIRAGVNVSF